MPELPEVETTRLALEPHLVGKKIASLTIRRRDLRWPIPKGLEQKVAGQKILRLRRIGKYIIIDLTDNLPTEQGEARSGGGSVSVGAKAPISLIVHLGMSGSFRISSTLPKTLKTHDHLILKMTGGKTAIYHDPRRFGFLLPCPTADLMAHPLLAKMGADPLDEKNFTADYLRRVFAARKAPIKQVLMDQHLIAGIGNIYASEALFLAHIHPERAANTVTKKECEKLKIAVKKVLKAALQSGGSTLRDFVRGENETGYFQHQFQVYDRADQPCTQCSNIIKKLVQSSRATYFCAKCQPKKPMKK